MKAKKIRVLALVIMTVFMVSVCAGVLSACNDKDGGSDELIFMAYAPANEQSKTIYNQILEAFTQETGIKVKPIYVPKDSYNTKLSSNFKTKDNKPDVFYLDQPVLADYVAQCLNLDTGFFAEEGQEGLKKSDFFASAMDTAVYNGSTYAVPFSLTTSVLLYNKALVTELPTNWNEWKNMSVPADKALFGGIGAGGYASWYFQAFLKSAGGQMVANNKAVFNSAEAVNATQMVVDLYAKSPKTVRETTNAFATGKVMFTLAHSADIVNFYSANPTWCAQNMGASLFIPKEDGGVSYSNIGGENLAIRKDSGKEEQAKQLVKFLLREENVTKLIGQNFSAIKSLAKVPTNNPITGEAYSEVVKDALGKVLAQLDTASARPAVKGWTKVNDMYLANALADILENGENIQSALDRAVGQAEQVLEFE